MGPQSVRAVPCVCSNEIRLVHEVSQESAILVSVFMVGESGLIEAQMGIEVTSYDEHVVCRNRGHSS